MMNEMERRPLSLLRGPWNSNVDVLTRIVFFSMHAAHKVRESKDANGLGQSTQFHKLHGWGMHEMGRQPNPRNKMKEN